MYVYEILRKLHNVALLFFVNAANGCQFCLYNATYTPFCFANLTFFCSIKRIPRQTCPQCLGSLNERLIIILRQSEEKENSTIEHEAKENRKNFFLVDKLCGFKPRLMYKFLTGNLCIMV